MNECCVQVFTEANLDVLVGRFSSYMRAKHTRDMSGTQETVALRDTMMELMRIYRSRGDLTKGVREINSSLLLAARDRYVGRGSSGHPPRPTPASRDHRSFLDKLKNLRCAGEPPCALEDLGTADTGNHSPDILDSADTVDTTYFTLPVTVDGVYPQFDILRNILQLKVNRLHIPAASFVLAPGLLFLDVRLSSKVSGKVETVCSMVCDPRFSQTHTDTLCMIPAQNECKVFSPLALASLENHTLTVHMACGGELTAEHVALGSFISLMFLTC